MFESITNTRSPWRTFWPKLDHIAGAEEAIRIGAWMTLFSAGVELLAAMLSAMDGDSAVAIQRLITFVYFGLLVWAMRNRSRTVVVIGFAFYVTWMAWMMSRGFIPGLFTIVALVGILNGVRGIYALGRLRAGSPSLGVKPV